MDASNISLLNNRIAEVVSRTQETNISYVSSFKGFDYCRDADT